VPGTAAGTLLVVDDLEEAPAAAAALGGGPAIVLARRASGDEEVGSAAGPGGAAIAGVLLLQDLPHLSHLGVRARQEGLPFAACAGLGVVSGGGEGEDDGVDRMHVGRRVRVAISADGAVAVVPDAGNTAASPKSAPAAAAAPAAPPPEVDMRPVGPIALAGAAPETCGPKAAACGALLRAAAASGAAFTAPPGFVLPFGALPATATAAGVGRDLAAALEAVDAAAAAVMAGGAGGGGAAAADLAALDAAAAAARGLVASLRPDPAALASAVQAHLPPGVAAVAVRSSSSAEDLAGAAAAGLFESVLGVPLPSPAVAAAAAASPTDAWDPLATAVGQVWASLFSRRAVLARAAAGGGQGGAAMAVLIQAQAPAALSFILHTADPAAPAGRAAGDTLVAEVAVGAGEALASGGVAGSPWRLAVEKKGGRAASVRSFANLSSALLPVAGGGAASQAGGASLPSTLAWRPVDYSRHPLSCDGEALQALGAALGAAGAALEAAAGGVPQDVEGCFGPGALAALGGQGLGKGATLVPVIVQTRPQPGAAVKE
jgi:phosphoglucan,water dikinase